MAVHLLAKDILQKIILEKIPFSLALKQTFKNGNVSKEDRSAISAVVGCSLRHYIVMERIIKDAYPELESEGLLALIVAISNALFIKRISQDECNAFAQSFLKEEDEPFTKFLAPYLDGKKLVPEEIEIGSFDFLSYRYNTPLPVIKMWNKQFGQITTSRILRSNNKPGPIVLRINNVKISDEDFFSQFPEFESCDIPGVALYKGEGKMAKNSPVFEKQLAAVLTPAYKEMLDDGDVDLLRGLAVYAEYPNDLLIELSSRFENINNVEFVAGTYSAFINTKNSLNRFYSKGNS